MLKEKPNIMYWAHNVGCQALMNELGWIEPGETLGVACLYVGPDGRIDRRYDAAYVISDGTYFDVYGTGELAHIVYQYIGSQVRSWAVRLHIGEDAPEPDYYV